MPWFRAHATTSITQIYRSNIRVLEVCWLYACRYQQVERKCLLAPTHVYIVGAGFSLHAGLPLQTEFTKALLASPQKAAHDIKPLTAYLGNFVHDVFDHNKTAMAKFWPELEDVFTNIDLAANTGHHLGRHHAPSELRMTRRVLLSRMMSMLNERFTAAEATGGPLWAKLDKFFTKLDVSRSAFISMNWDTVIERRLSALRGVNDFDYKCDAIRASFPVKGKRIVELRPLLGSQTIPVVKMHGSVNWLYCDNCRQLYWFPAAGALNVAKQLITQTEAKKLGLVPARDFAKWNCRECVDVPLTTRIATFSYLKALDFPMFERSWLSAEELLRHAKRWIFIGYSLPAADYEFKHLLKRVQLSREAPPEFVVVTGGKKNNTDNTYRNYQGFFGRDIRRKNNGDQNFFARGLTAQALAAIRE
jgi:hypothetical protein